MPQSQKEMLELCKNALAAICAEELSEADEILMYLNTVMNTEESLGAYADCIGLADFALDDGLLELAEDHLRQAIGLLHS
jgi:hypothetical protein